MHICDYAVVKVALDNAARAGSSSKKTSRSKERKILQGETEQGKVGNVLRIVKFIAAVKK